ncbi:MAG: SDR family oxidoreductase [Flavobacteriales bacterium]|nr:MAG: SDR family oxidoreductase [Flavobacteriales bacterium]
MNRLTNKVAVITGGAAGIGKATAQLFLSEGAKVFLVDNQEKELQATAKELNSPNVAFCTADVSKSIDVKNYVQKALRTFDRIDVFFNNAGIEGTAKSIAEYPEEIFDRVIAVNLKGVWLGCQYVIPKMTEGGSVIITSSVAGLKGFPGLGAYVASKHGALGIMRTAALEFAKTGIRVNSIHPGPVATKMMQRIEVDMSPEKAEEVHKGFESSIPFRRYATAEEVAQLALFFASDDSRYITGDTHVIDGGMIGN